MGIELPKLTQEEIEQIVKELTYVLTYHKEIDENELDAREKAEYEIWKVEYESELLEDDRED